MNKRIIVLGVVILAAGAYTTPALALSLVGPPTAGLKKGQLSAGYSYSYSDQDLDTATIKWWEFENGVLAWNGSEPLKVKNFKTQPHLGTIGYGLAEWLEVYATLGAADTKAHFEWPEEDSERGHNFDNDFIWGLGAKATFARQDKVAWGAAVQVNWLDTKWSENWADAEGPRSNRVDLKGYDVLVAVGPTVDMNGWRLYGGPFYYYLDLEYRDRYTWVDGDGDNWVGRCKGDLEADSNFGGFIGTQFDIFPNCGFTTEFAVTGGGWGAGAGIVLRCR